MVWECNEIIKGIPFYQENKLKTEGPTISLQFETNDAKKKNSKQVSQ